MRITDLPSISRHARGIGVRRDVATILSSIAIAAERGVDVTEHVTMFREFMATCAKELKRIKSAEQRSLVAAKAEEPAQLELNLEDL